MPGFPFDVTPRVGRAGRVAFQETGFPPGSGQHEILLGTPRECACSGVSGSEYSAWAVGVRSGHAAVRLASAPRPVPAMRADQVLVTY
ncbi:hypothetical protein LR393_32295 [Kineosporia mesophila]|uniref:hypothetical protein n=1 Tax=Kineosporia mesophila TaxID=566012 RepID=UPI001E4EF39A|nr:hypothetical protein [Kineosporia mesophila]MCD5354772.1 hypothetical protein [Kineosporia mesophila]